MPLGSWKTLNLYQSQFSWILLPYTRVYSPNPPYPRVAVFQKLLRSLGQFSQNKTLYHNHWSVNLQPTNQFPEKWYPILDPNALIYIPYPRVNCLKTIPFTAAHTYIAQIWQYPRPPRDWNSPRRGMRGKQRRTQPKLLTSNAIIRNISWTDKYLDKLKSKWYVHQPRPGHVDEF